MKKLMLVMLSFALFMGARAQETSLDLDFSDPSHADRFNFIFDTGGELTKTVSDGVMKLELNKKEWHFFQVWVEPFDFIHNPYLSFKIKVDKDTPLRIWIKNAESEKELFNAVVPASDDFQTFQLSFEDLSPLVGDMQELGLDIGGYQTPPATFSATVFFDYIRLGEAAKPLTEVYGTSYSEDFSSELYAGWAGGEGYSLVKDEETLRFDVNRFNPVTEDQINKLPSLSFMGKVLDLSENPVINLDVKGADPFVLSVIASDDQRTRTEHKIRVFATDKFQTISLDLSTVPGLDLSKIEKLYFDFNRDGFFFNSTVWIDNLTIGGQAANLAVMDAIEDKTYYKNSGTIELELTHIQNATAIEVVDVPDFIENASVSEIDSTSANLTFTVRPDMVGQDSLTLELKGADGYEDHRYSFALKIEDNMAPSMDSLADIQVERRDLVKIDLTGISDGNSTVEQALSFEVTSSDPKVVIGKVLYKGEGPSGTLLLLIKRKGTATVTVAVKDDGDHNNSSSISFNVDSYIKLNAPPTIDSVADMEVYQDVGPSQLTLTGISGGDKKNQDVSISVENSNPEIVKEVSVDYTSGDTAILSYVPVADTTGTSTITVYLKDNGGTNFNDGNDSTAISFTITVLQRPVTGYVATLEKEIEGFKANEKYTITEVDSAGFKALVFEAVDKFYWDGVFMDLPVELDLSEHPYLTMEVYPVDESTIHWIWLYDVNGRRNDLNNLDGDHIQRPVAGQWNKLVFDFSGENDWMGGDTPINSKRITGILFDMHNADSSWPPPPNYTGTFVIRNLRIGSAADFTPMSVNSIHPIANQTAFTNAVDQKVQITGLTDGSDDLSGANISIENSNPEVVSNLSVSEIDSLGHATLSYSTGSMPGRSTITLTISSDSSADSVVSFVIDVLSSEASDAAVVTLDMSQKFQKMYGFGTFSNSSQYSEIYTDLMGGSAMRLGLIGNVLEPVNDNDDPNVLNMEALNYDAFDWDYYKDLKARGVETFILTSWGPPAWMKTNLSNDYKAAGFSLNTDETTNRLDYSMYDEFAESMVLTVKAFQQRAGITLEAIGLQNEPVFHEPYASAILDVEHFKELIKIVGARFEKEGITTRLYFAEHIVDEGDFFLPQNIDYLNAVKNDPVADKYGDIFAVHGYGTDGITPGQPTYNAWETLWSIASSGDNPKELWMTETYLEYQSWEDAFSIAGAIYGALEHGNVSLWTQWGFEGQMATQGKPTPMLYAMSNFAKFIRPGHVRISSTETNGDILVTSFLDESNGQVSVVLLNKSDVAISARVTGGGMPETWETFVTAENRNLDEMNGPSAEGVILLPPYSVTTMVGSSPLEMASIDNQEVAAGTTNHAVLLTGLKNTRGGAEGLRLKLQNSKETIIRDMLVSEVNADGTATLTFSANNTVGKSSVTVHLSDDSGNTTSRSFDVKVVDLASNNRSNKPEKTLGVFPNPADDIITIASDEEGDRVLVTDLMGKVLINKKLENGNRTVDVSKIKGGVYILKMNTPNGYKSTTIIIE